LLGCPVASVQLFTNFDTADKKFIIFRYRWFNNPVGDQFSDLFLDVVHLTVWAFVIFLFCSSSFNLSFCLFKLFVLIGSVSNPNISLNSLARSASLLREFATPTLTPITLKSVYRL